MPTPTKIDLSVLRTLHRIHRQLTDLKSRLDRGPKQIHAAEANVQHHEDLLVRTKDEAKTLRKNADQKQLQLKSNEDKVRELRVKLNGASSNREYQALLEQIAADEMAKSVLEDEILEAMEKTDGFQKNIAEAEASVKTARQKLEQVRVEVAEREPHLTADADRLEAELKTAEETLPDEVREKYRRVVRGLGEDALAVVENQYCTGCNQKIPLNMLNQVMLGQPVFCKSCGRLLYLPE